jgi:hypothetical protein
MSPEQLPLRAEMTISLLSRLSCCLAGHDYTIKRVGSRMVLYCTACEHCSDGISLTDPPTVSLASQAAAMADGRRSSAVPRELPASR